MGQIPLTFPHHASYAADDFLVHKGNEVACQALANMAFGLVMYGEVGVGKTHLLALWSGQHKAVNALSMPPVAGAVLAIDDVDQLSASQQEQLFHWFNALKEQGGQLLFTSTQPVAQLALLPDLQSRLLTLPQVEIGLPAEQDLAKLLLKWADDRQLQLDQPVVKYLMTRAARSPGKLEAMVAQLDQTSLAQKRAITIPFVRELLEAGQPDEDSLG